MKSKSSRKRWNLFICILVLVVLTALPAALMGQPGLPRTPEQAPIDGGLSILAAMGGGYAIKKLRDKKN